MRLDCPEVGPINAARHGAWDKHMLVSPRPWAPLQSRQLVYFLGQRAVCSLATACLTPALRHLLPDGSHCKLYTWSLLSAGVVRVCGGDTTGFRRAHGSIPCILDPLLFLI